MFSCICNACLLFALSLFPSAFLSMYAQSQRGDNTVHSVQGQDSEHLARGRGGQGSRPVPPHQARNHPSSHFLPLTLPTSPNCGLCVEDSKQVCCFARDLYYLLQLFITIIYPVLNVCFLRIKHAYYTLSTVAMMSDQNKRHGQGL